MAGKTGTAENFQDAWFCGYVPAARDVRLGRLPEGRDPSLDVEGVAQVAGGTLPAEIWHDFMWPAVANLPVKDFPTSSDPYGGTPSAAPGRTYSYSQYPSPTG